VWRVCVRFHVCMSVRVCQLFIHPLEIRFTQLYEDYEVSQTLAPLLLDYLTSILELQFDSRHNYNKSMHT
jgi:hypothetical protein